MSTPAQETKAPSTTTTPTPATTTSSGGGGSSGSSGVSRGYLRGASYDDGAAAVAPGAPAEKKSLRSRLTEGATGYDVHGEGVTEDGNGYVRGSGRGWGNRDADTEKDVDEKDPSKGKEREAEKVKLSDITGIPEPELDKLPEGAKKEIAGRFGSYAGYETAAGTARGSSTDFEAKLTHDGEEGGLEVEGPNAYYQAGVRGKAYAGIKGEAEGDYGKVEGKAEAYASGYAGLSGKAGINQDGASAEGVIGAGVEVGVTADADYKTKGIEVEGVEDGVTAGIGVHGEAKAYAKAGAGGGAYLTKDKIGLWGSAGAAAAAEAKADVHGHLGPVGVTVEAGVMAGAGAGIEGGILYEDGKLKIGGRMYAALGYGASFGGSVEIDLKQAYHIGVAVMKKAKELGLAGAKAAFEAADADNDGKLSLNDAATHGSNAMMAGAEGMDKGVDGIISALDRDGSGGFDLKKDGAAALDQAGKAATDLGKRAYKAGSEMVDGAVAKGKEAAAAAHKAADQDGDGSLGVNDLVVGAEKVGKRVEKGIEDAGKALSDAKDSAVKWGTEKIDAAKKLADDAKKFMDRDGDGSLGVDDVKKGAGELVDGGKAAVKAGAEWVGDKAKAGAEWVGDKAKAGAEWAGAKYDAAKKGAADLADKAHKSLDRSGDGSLGMDDAKIAVKEAGKAVADTYKAAEKKVADTYVAAKKAAADGYKRAYDAADLNKDGKVDSADAKLGVEKAKAVATATYKAAEKKVADGYATAKKTVTAVATKAIEVKDAVVKTLDKSGDGKVSAGEAYDYAAAKASEAKTAVVAKATAVVDSAKASISQAADTLSAGYTAASDRAGAAWNRLTGFFGGD